MTSSILESPNYGHYFYVGGKYRDDETANGEHVFTGQMYVEQLTPVNGVKQPWPTMFIRGAGQTGTVSSRMKYMHFDHAHTMKLVTLYFLSLWRCVIPSTAFCRR